MALFLRKTHVAFEARYDFSILYSTLVIGTWSMWGIPQECTTVGLAPHSVWKMSFNNKKAD